MAWNASGEERAKSYRVYKQLEEQYLQLRQECDILRQMLETKNASIRQLATELSQALGQSVEHLEGIQAALEAGPATHVANETKTPSESLVVPSMPGLKKTSGTMSKVSLPLSAKVGNSGQR